MISITNYIEEAEKPSLLKRVGKWLVPIGAIAAAGAAGYYGKKYYDNRQNHTSTDENIPVDTGGNPISLSNTQYDTGGNPISTDDPQAAFVASGGEMRPETEFQSIGKPDEFIDTGGSEENPDIGNPDAGGQIAVRRNEDGSEENPDTGSPQNVNRWIRNIPQDVRLFGKGPVANI